MNKRGQVSKEQAIWIIIIVVILYLLYKAFVNP